PIELRHADIEKCHVGGEFVGQLQRFHAVRGQPQAAGRRPMLSQLLGEYACQQRFVFGDDVAIRLAHAAGLDNKLSGTSMAACVPRGVPGSRTRRAALPNSDCSRARTFWMPAPVPAVCALPRPTPVSSTDTMSLSP